MNNDFKIDFHKLDYHPGRTGQWLEAKGWKEAKTVYPIYIEVSPSGFCNHRCTFCSLDFMGYQRKFLDSEVLKTRISEMAKLGVKSIMFAGEGEPLLHKEMSEITVHAKKAGIDTSFTTNGTPLTEKFCQKTLEFISWIKVSINAGKAETYSKIHTAPKEHFNLVLKNIENAVKIRNEKGYACTIGAQILLLPENQDEVLALAEKIKNAGGDYLIVKPHSQHPKSQTELYEGLIYNPGDLDEMERESKKIENQNFKVIIRKNTAIKLEEDSKPYSKCYSTPFLWAYISADGDVYSCSMFLGDKRFLLGNINKQGFQKIWEGGKRKENWELMKNFDVSNCRKNCRMEECNRFLHRLKNPPPHVNFI